MAFCDYCDCRQCRTGISLMPLHHAKTVHGDWICEVCYLYDECAQHGINPCENKDCIHRPRLISDFEKRKCE